MEIICGSKIIKIEDSKEGKLVTIACGEVENTTEVELVAISVGQKPNIHGLGLEQCVCK